MRKISVSIIITILILIGVCGCMNIKRETLEDKMVRYMNEKYPEDEFFYIIGADSLFAIERWIHPELLFPNCIILAACRDEIDTSEEMNAQIDYLCKKYDAQIEYLKSPLVDISSSELREMIKNGQSICGHVPQAVEAFIAKEGLYE